MKLKKRVKQKGDIVPNQKVELPVQEVLENLEHCERQNKFDTAVMAKVPHVLVDYKQDLENQSFHQATLDRCCQSLQLTKVEAQTKFVKISPSKFTDYIANWSEIFTAVSDSPYKSYLLQQ